MTLYADEMWSRHSSSRMMSFSSAPGPSESILYFIYSSTVRIDFTYQLLSDGLYSHISMLYTV